MNLRALAAACVCLGVAGFAAAQDVPSDGATVSEFMSNPHVQGGLVGALSQFIIPTGLWRIYDAFPDRFTPGIRSLTSWIVGLVSMAVATFGFNVPWYISIALYQAAQSAGFIHDSAKGLQTAKAGRSSASRTDVPLPPEKPATGG